MWRDTRVWIREGDRVRMGVTAGLNEIGALRVRWPDGHEEVLLAGDVNIREACGGSTP
jgi:hypothetical protein